MQSDLKSKLLAAAAQLSSSESDSASGSGSDSAEARRRRRKAEKKHRSSSSKKRKKHSKDKDSKTKSHKRHKRSDHEKIAELERRAAAMGAAAGGGGVGSRLGFGVFRHPPHLSAGFGASAASAGDAVMLDTSGDANNSLYESLYGGDVPRYNRLDPLDLVRASRKLGGGAAATLRDADVGNMNADRYYRGRHYLQERSRSVKRIHLSDLQQQHGRTHASTTGTAAGHVAGISISSSGAMLPLPTTTPLLPPDKASSAAAAAGGASSIAQPQQQGVGGSNSSRRLAMPAPSFIPLEAPQELLQQGGAAGGSAAQQDAGSWRQQGGGVGGSSAGRGHSSLVPTELVEQAGLSLDELLLQATRAWNVALRERPQEEELWLEFAAFQHYSAAQQQQQRGRGVSTAALDPVIAEKQISLLSRGLAHHPSSTQLLLALLRAYAAVAPDADAQEAKWAGVLTRQGGSWELWREYIAIRQSSFADFKVSGLQKVYQDALHSLQLELIGQRRRTATAAKQHHHQQQRAQVGGSGSSISGDLTPQQLAVLTPLGAAAAAAAAASAAGSTGSSSGLGLGVSVGEEALELQLVQLLLGLLCVELEAGYSEQALAKIQALLEFHLFAPPLPPGGVAALLRLFAGYWGGGVPRIGEAGARGWAYWCLWHAMGMEQPVQREQEQEQAAAAEEEQEQEQQQQEPAGWSGWFEVPAAAAGPAAAAAADKQADTAAANSPAAGAAAAAAAAGDDADAAAAAAAASGSASEGAGDGSDANSDEQQSSAAAGVDADEDEEEEEVDEGELMRQLGLQLEQQLQQVEREGLPADVMERWVREEAACSASQWQPLRSSAAGTTGASAAAGGGGGEDDDDAAVPPDPARLAGLDVVQPCLFLLRSRAALQRLVLGCVELLVGGAGGGGGVGGTTTTGVLGAVVPWCCSNCPTPLQQQQAASGGGGTAAAWLFLGGSSGSTAVGGWSDAAADGSAGAAATTSEQQQQQQWLQCRQVPWYAASDERWQLAVNVLQRLVAGGPCSDWPELCQALLLLQASKPSDAAAAAGGLDGDGAPGSGRSEQHTDHNSLQQLTLDGAASATTGAATEAAAAAGPPVWPSQAQLSAARAAAKQLLSDQQDNLLLYDAYGCLEAAAGQVRTARKVFETALALATTAAAWGAGVCSSAAAASATGNAAQEEAAVAAAAAAAAAPLLALHLAQLELVSGGKQGPTKAHVVLHALLAGQQLQAAAAAEAGPSSASAAAGGGGSGSQPPQQQQQKGGGGLLADDRLRAARVRFQQRVPELVASAGGFLTPAAASTIAAAALFELTVGLRRGQPAAGLDAAVAVCKQVSGAGPEPVRAASAQHEQLVVLQCHMLVAAATGNTRALAPALGPPLQASSKGGSSSSSSSSSSDAALAAALAAAVPPVRAREALAAGLQLYPHSPALLQLQVALDHACCTLAGLRRQLLALTELYPSPGLWAVALQAEGARPGGRVRMGVMFERALAAPTVLQWHQQERVQRQRQRRAWLAALSTQESSSSGSSKSSEAERRQELLLQPVAAAASAATLLDLAVWDGYRGWGHCSALWQQYIQYELGLGRLDAARKLFLRAVHAAPGAKALWLSGLGGVCAGLAPRECSGLLNAMQEREVLVRTDVYEVLLAAMAEKQQQMEFDAD